MTTKRTPTPVPTHDKATRRRAATTVARAYVGSLTFWTCLLVFSVLSALMIESAWTSYRNELGADLIAGSVVLAVVFLATGLLFVPLAMGLTIYRARELYYLDTGTARAALATKPDTRKNALPGDVHAHSFGAWPKKQNAGKVLGEWVRNDVHTRGGRLTGTALPGLAKTYMKHGMIDDGRTAIFLVRVASKE